MKTIITPYKYRLILAKKNPESNINWLFLPGGLGLGSEYFIPFIESLFLPGNIWRGDFPEDGSNRFNENLNFNELWQPGLLEAIQSLGKVVLATHSVSSMLALTIPELNSILTGLVIISSAPSSKWRDGVKERAKGRNLPCIQEKNQIYENNRNDITFKQFFISILDYYIDIKYKENALLFFNDLPYHHRRYEWLIQHFHSGYQASWVPTNLSGFLTPDHLIQFSKNFMN